MSGGSGLRFWPLSRKNCPKQYLNIVSDKSMIRMTFDRISNLAKPSDIFAVTSSEQSAILSNELPELPIGNIISEPFGMNTAPAIGLSLVHMKKKCKPDDVVVVLPADHLIEDLNAFHDSLHLAKSIADKGYLLTFGIKPAYPATGYGYIETGSKISENVFNVANFKEKPDYKTAAQFCAKGNFFWNSGIFVWRLDKIMDAYREFLPEFYQTLNEISAKWDSDGVSSDISSLYSKSPKVPVDIAILEKAKQRAVIPVDYGWSDVGSWEALSLLKKNDADKNVMECPFYATINSKSNFVKTKKLTALINVNNLIVVESDDAILIADKKSSEKVKDLVLKLKNNGLEKYT
jgi:mannose-1-phosphate guanylyltransferase